jgi:MSHA pilin protein MshD
MLLTLGALILLSILTLGINTSQLSTQDTMQNSKLGVLAVSVASSIMEEASEKAFDETSVEDFVGSLTSLTNRNSFGTESGESPDSSNTFDDFDGYSIVDSTMPSALFNVNCSVNYINPDLVVICPI